MCQLHAGHAFFSKELNILVFFCVLLRSFEKKAVFFAFFCILYKRTLRSLRSFTFFLKECCVLCILLRSLQKNVAFFAFFYVLCKRTLRSFTLLRKECKRAQKNASFFWVSYVAKNSKKEGKSMLRALKERKRTMLQNAKERGAQP